eukprot:2580121-Prymnesium_polylepis.1
MMKSARCCRAAWAVAFATCPVEDASPTQTKRIAYRLFPTRTPPRSRLNQSTNMMADWRIVVA